MKRHCRSFAGLYPLSMPYIFTSGSNILKIDLDVYGDCFKYRYWSVLCICLWAGFRPGRICDLSSGIQLQLSVLKNHLALNISDASDLFILYEILLVAGIVVVLLYCSEHQPLLIPRKLDKAMSNQNESMILFCKYKSKKTQPSKNHPLAHHIKETNTKKPPNKNQKTPKIQRIDRRDFLKLSGYCVFVFDHLMAQPAAFCKENVRSQCALPLKPN